MVMLRWSGLYGLLSLLLLSSSLLAQTPETDLSLNDVRIEASVDAFGETRQIATGTIENHSTRAYTDVVVAGDVLNDDGQIIGEAWGGLVDVCGSTLFDPLEPGQTRRFAAPLDLFEDADSLDVQLEIEGTSTTPEGQSDILHASVTRVTRDEVVRVEWEDETSLRYAIGCPTEVFTRYTWYRYNLITEDSRPIQHPSADAVTDAFIATARINAITQTSGREEDPSLFDRSMLTFAPNGERAIFQTDRHDVMSIGAAGDSLRRVQTGLYQHTLQGYIFTPESIFLAYYYGTYGDPVRYVIGTVARGPLGLGINQVTPSVTVPGVTTDGQRVIISGTFPIQGEDTTGYFWQRVDSASRELLFETTDLPGNNYPAPVFFRKDDDTRFIYIIRPINNLPTLQCFHYESKTLTTLTSVPLSLADAERAGAWISPEGQTLALAAIGAHGGLWQIDLDALPSCEADNS